ncbi:MAG: alanine dehydrogenase [Chlorobi bacterium]|nr:alanine dehydrogenase [Chlorobiota bacterium]
MKIGLIREMKTPPDKRVPLVPEQCKQLMEKYPSLEVVAQSSDVRCFSDDDYKKEGIRVVDDVSDCDVLMGVKEVPKDKLIHEKTYFFFSHTIKKQPYNKDLLREVLKRNIRLIDYEVLTDKKGFRLIGFGHFAGLVGAYNALLTYGKRYNRFNLKPANQCYDLKELKMELGKVKLPSVKIAVTGNGRVANGVVEILETAGIKRLAVDDYLSGKVFNGPVYVQLEPGDYNKHKGGKEFDLMHFFKYPEEYENNFKRFIPHTDILISAAYWDPKAPVLFENDDMRSEDFRIRVIADITCDIKGSIPSTIRACTIAEPVYDYDPWSEEEKPPFSDEKYITVMAVDTLPGELPVDASREFGEQLINGVLPHLLSSDEDEIIERATIAKNGRLTEYFEYLRDYVEQG